jgi:hypothetical protein
MSATYLVEETVPGYWFAFLCIYVDSTAWIFNEIIWNVDVCFYISLS